MAMTDDAQMNSAEDQYKAAFDETNGPGESAGSTGDFGIEPPAEAIAAAAADDSSTGGEAEAVSAETATPVATEPTEPANTEMADAQPTEQPGAEAEADSGGMTEQQLKSWEGRLRKMEADLKAKPGTTEEAASEALEAGAAESPDPSMGDAMGQAAEQVESGAMSVEQAMKSLAEDFGEPFVKMIEAIASATAGKAGASALAGVSSEVNEIISHISDVNERTHFERIEAAHSDFNDLRQDPAFLEYVAADPANQQVAGAGSAAEVIKLIQSFKDQAPKRDSGDTPAPEPVAKAPQQDSPEGADVDAATGVRSAGMQIPDKPAESDDYEGAFAEATRGGR